MTPTDSDLLIMLCRGDQRAMKMVFDRHYAMLCRFACRIVRNQCIAEEVVDDVMLNLWQQREKLYTASSLAAWLVCSVRNRSLNALRDAIRHNRHLCMGLSDGEHLDFLECIFADPRHPLGTLIEKELCDELARSVDALPHECRSVFRKVRMEAKTYDQAARELGISVNTVKYHMKKALAALALRFGPYLDVIVALWVMQ